MKKYMAYANGKLKIFKLDPDNIDEANYLICKDSVEFTMSASYGLDCLIPVEILCERLDSGENKSDCETIIKEVIAGNINEQVADEVNEFIVKNVFTVTDDDYVNTDGYAIWKPGFKEIEYTKNVNPRKFLFSSSINKFASLIGNNQPAYISVVDMQNSMNNKADPTLDTEVIYLVSKFLAFKL